MKLVIVSFYYCDWLCFLPKFRAPADPCNEIILVLLMLTVVVSFGFFVLIFDWGWVLPKQLRIAEFAFLSWNDF